jgi:hypothetical protein
MYAKIIKAHEIVNKIAEDRGLYACVLYKMLLAKDDSLPEGGKAGAGYAEGLAEGLIKGHKAGYARGQKTGYARGQGEERARVIGRMRELGISREIIAGIIREG